MPFDCTAFAIAAERAAFLAATCSGDSETFFGSSPFFSSTGFFSSATFSAFFSSGGGGGVGRRSGMRTLA